MLDGTREIKEGGVLTRQSFLIRKTGGGNGRICQAKAIDA